MSVSQHDRSTQVSAGAPVDAPVPGAGLRPGLEHVDLLAPIASARFFDEYWQRRPPAYHRDAGQIYRRLRSAALRPGHPARERIASASQLPSERHAAERR